MLGLGETEEEVIKTMKDLLDVGVDILTLGQFSSLQRNIYQLKIILLQKIRFL